MMYGYARVSTKIQLKNGNSLEEQRNQLIKEGCEIIIEEQFTGSIMHRPKFVELVSQLETGDTLMVTKLDRFARNVSEGIEVIRKLFANGVRVHVLNVGLLENTAMGNFFLTTLLAVAELERSMIMERTQAGKEIAMKRSDYKDGRPRTYNDFDIQNSLALLTNHSFSQVAKLTGISRATLLRRAREEREKALVATALKDSVS